MIAVFVTSLLRARMRPGTWRAVHWLAYLCWPIALAHTFGMGTDAGEHWVIALGVVCFVSVAAALAWRLRGRRDNRRLAAPRISTRYAAEASGAHGRDRSEARRG